MRVTGGKVLFPPSLSTGYRSHNSGESLMDPATLALSGTSFLAPYLAKAGGAILDRATAALPDEAGHLWDAITKHFASKPAAAAAATELVQQPSDEDQQAAFAL